MAKAILSPLLFLLISSIIAIIMLYSNISYRNEKGKRILKIYFVVILVIYILSMPVVSVKLAYIMESPYLAHTENRESLKNAEIITVLAGGVRKGVLPSQDKLAEASYARIETGVEVFKQIWPRLLVVQGTGSVSEEHHETATLMQDLAVAMGIPAVDIKREMISMNTYQHPPELLKMAEVRKEDKIVVVTSAWHLRRSIREFKRYFTDVVGYPADFYSSSLEGGVIDWIPSVDGLKISTTIIHEMIGIVWYQLRHFTEAFIR